MNNILEDLANAARTCTNYGYRRQLDDARNVVVMLLKRLHEEPTYKHMEALNGAWTNAHRIIVNVPKEAPPNPFGAAGTEDVRLAA